MRIFKLTLVSIGAILWLTNCTSKINKNPEITSQEIYDHIAYLASDSLKGRYPGSEGGQAAGEYIHQQLSEYGLTPVCENGYQHFKVVTGCSLGDSNLLVVNNDTMELDTDYRPMAFSSNASVSGEVTFVGYGFEIETENLKWNDYAMVDVTGKWVMILREDPEPDNMDSEFIDFSSDRAKATLAHDKGAIGILFVNGTRTSRMDTPIELTFDQNLSNSGIPVISITRETANKILEGSDSIESIEKTIIEKKSPMVLRTKTQVIAKTNVIQDFADAKNVVFEVKATNPTDQYVVLGAHYDHLGMGGKGVSSRAPDTIAPHNGADDNASGVAGIIELAGYFAAHKDTLQKNILVAAFDGEEMGVLGSKYFVQNLPVKKEQVKAMFNFDMIGRMKADSIGISIGGTGTAVEFDTILAQNKPYFNVVSNPDGYGPSDHAPFYSEGIPVLFFSTGAHADYHTPADDIDKIKPGKEADILKYSTKLIYQVATNQDTLTFQTTGNSQHAQRRTRLKITLGIIPDMAGVQKNGLGIDGVRQGGRADKGGLLKGDKITAINGEPVTNIYDYMYRMSKLKLGTTAVVEIERNNKKEVVLIQL